MQSESEKLILRGVRIKNYKSFRVFPGDNEFLPLGNLNTIIGKNDIGKSNLLHAIMTVLEDDKISIEDFHKYNTNESCEISLKFDIPESLKENSELRNFLGSNRYITVSKIFSYNLAKDKIEMKNIINSMSRDIKNIKEFFPKVIFIPGIKKIEDEIKLTRDSIISKLMLPLIETENILQAINNIVSQINKEVETIWKDLLKLNKQLWEDLERINITIDKFNIQKTLTPGVKVKDKSLPAEVDLTSRGYGFQRYFVVSLLELYRRRNIGKGFVLLFEEPEIYLHYGAQRKLANILKDFSKQG